MARYQIWDGVSDIYTINERLTPEQWRARYPWAGAPGAKMIISAGVINGGVAMEFEQTKATYAAMGAAITDGMTDAEVLAAIEDYEDHPPAPEPQTDTPEAQIAAALMLLAEAKAAETELVARVAALENDVKIVKAAAQTAKV